MNNISKFEKNEIYLFVLSGVRGESNDERERMNCRPCFQLRFGIGLRRDHLAGKKPGKMINLNFDNF